MRVGLNLLYYIPGMGGVETFGRELAGALRELHPEGVEFVLFTSREAEELRALDGPGMRVVVCPFHARHRGVRYLWEQLVLPWQVLAYGLDLLHSLSYVGPLLCPAPSMVTVHDANSWVVAMQALRRAVLGNISLWAARRATLVTTVSSFSRDEIVKWYQVPAQRIEVVASGPGNTLPQQAPEPEAGLSIEGPYLATIGGTYVHKNIPRLVEAFLQIAGRIPHRLVIVGKIPPAVQQMLGRLGERRIVVTGFLPANEMRAVIAHSDLFVMPSLYEGFGFPVLEAQAQGVPVACSNAGSLPEVTGESAVRFDPENVQEMAEALVRCVTDRALNEELRKRGRENAARYSWHNAAREYLECYARVAGRR